MHFFVVPEYYDLFVSFRNSMARRAVPDNKDGFAVTISQTCLEKVCGTDPTPEIFRLQLELASREDDADVSRKVRRLANVLHQKAKKQWPDQAVLNAKTGAAAGSSLDNLDNLHGLDLYSPILDFWKMTRAQGLDPLVEDESGIARSLLASWNIDLCVTKCTAECVSEPKPCP